MDFFLFHMHFFLASLHSIRQIKDHSQVFYFHDFYKCDISYELLTNEKFKLKITNVCSVTNKPILNSCRFSRTISCCVRSSCAVCVAQYQHFTSRSSGDSSICDPLEKLILKEALLHNTRRKMSEISFLSRQS